MPCLIAKSAGMDFLCSLEVLLANRSVFSFDLPPDSSTKKLNYPSSYESPLGPGPACFASLIFKRKKFIKHSWLHQKKMKRNGSAIDLDRADKHNAIPDICNDLVLCICFFTSRAWYLDSDMERVAWYTAGEFFNHAVSRYWFTESRHRP